jgi:two-component system chemotaxis sensor kinase CheA
LPVTNSELLEIRQAFAIEGAELLAEMESALLVLEADYGVAEEFNRLFRSVHTIKGSASIVRFDLVERFCHSIEHILVRVRENELALNGQLVALFLKCHDHIGFLLDQYCVAGDDDNAIKLPPTHAALLELLLEWMEDKHAVQEQPTYGTLDDSYLDINPTADASGFNFFEDTDDLQSPSQVQLPPVQLPLVLADDSVAASEKNARNQRVVRVDADRIDQLSDLVVELVTASSVLEAHVRKLGDLATTESSVHVADLIKQIQEKTMSFRMVPVQTLFQRFNRIIHDVGGTVGKQIKLLISGGETELDKAVAEKLHEPLLHLVRNAIDHGIEPALERAAHGKSPCGAIHLKAFHDSGNIVIRVSDDGQGINLENVARKAVERGLVKRELLPTGSEALLAYIFEPGFSTLEGATMLSGRGVGMDVVRKAVESIRGRIDVDTADGSGTTFQISIPLSLSLVDGFMVALGDNLYIMPMDLVLETMELPSAAQRAVMPNGSLQVRDRLIPCLDLRKVLGVEEPEPRVQHVVVFKYGGTGVGLIVDRLHGEIKTVVKPLGHLYRNVACISGSSILGDGSIALFLETGKLIETSKALKHGAFSA